MTEATEPSSAPPRQRVRFVLELDTPSRERIDGPAGLVTTPVELEVHVVCDRPEGSSLWRPHIGQVFLKGGKVPIPECLSPGGRAVEPLAHADHMLAAAAAMRTLLGYLWPGPGTPA